MQRTLRNDISQQKKFWGFAYWDDKNDLTIINKIAVKYQHFSQKKITVFFLNFIFINWKCKHCILCVTKFLSCNRRETVILKPRSFFKFFSEAWPKYLFSCQIWCDTYKKYDFLNTCCIKSVMELVFYTNYVQYQDLKPVLCVYNVIFTCVLWKDVKIILYVCTKN